MNNLILKTIKVDGKVIPVTDSREVALKIKIRHDDLLKKIRGYKAILDEDIEDSEILPSQKFFIEDTYINSQNKEQPCYQLTKQGCEMVANKMTGKKGVLFTATYVEAFNKMQEQLKVGQPKSINADLKQKEIETRNNNSFARVIESFNKALRNPNITKEAKKDLNNRLSQFLGGESKGITHLGRKTYSATEIGDKLGISSNKVGRLTETHNLKVEEFGEFFKEVTKSGKEVPSFRYYDTIIPVLKGLLGGKQEKLNV